jgi:hypothetical protein
VLVVAVPHPPHLYIHDGSISKWIAQQESPAPDVNEENGALVRSI